MNTDILVMYSNLTPTPEHVGRLRDMAAGRDVVVAASEREALAAAPSAEVFLGHRYFRQCLPRAPGLRWVQSTAAGVDALVCEELLRRRIPLSRCPVSSVTVAHHALAMAWALMRRLPDAARQQPERDWSWQRAFADTPRKALILGLGAIGLELARLLAALDVEVTGLCREATPERRAGCHRLLTGAGWREQLADTDLVFLLLPRTRATLDFFDAGAVDALPDHAVLVDVGRAGTIDVRHALHRLEQGRLLGLGLDVAHTAPFGEDCDWNLPGLLVTPKVSTFRPGRQADLEAYVEAQLARYLDGRAPLHRVPAPELEEMLVT